MPVRIQLHSDVFWQVALLRLKFEAEMLENESKARTRSEELSRRLAAETQSSEQKIAETAALQSKLLLAESQLTENAQSESLFA